MSGKHPIQKLKHDDQDVLRFVDNDVVRYLLDNGGLDLNDLARVDFNREDMVQFYQLIGYSLSGFGSLSQVSDDDYEIAHKMYKEKLSEKDAKVDYLTEELDRVRNLLRGPVAEIFNVSEENLSNGVDI